MDNFPLVSVIVPCYNHEDYIVGCIESIINQTYSNIQLIVIDDGSRDQSPKILKNLSDTHGFFFETQTNRGLCKTLNKAIREYANGKYICVLASDDYWELNKIEEQVRFLEKNTDHVIVFGKAVIIDEKNNQLGEMGEDIIPADLTFEKLLFDNKIIALTAMFRKVNWELVGGYNESSFIEDWDLWLKMAVDNKIGFMNNIQGYYRRHDNNMSSNLLKMENAKTAIINHWRGTPFYSKAYKHHILLKASILAVNFKFTSFKILYDNKRYFLNLAYLKACYRLLLIWR